MKKSRFDRSFEIYPPSPFFDINFEFPKFLRKWIRSEKNQDFRNSIDCSKSPLFLYQFRSEFEIKKSCQDFHDSLEFCPFFHINQFRISKILEKVNSRWKNRSLEIYPPPSLLFFTSINFEFSKFLMRKWIRNEKIAIQLLEI